MPSYTRFAAAVLAALLLLPGAVPPAAAQQQPGDEGYVRIQGRDFDDDEQRETVRPQAYMDLREEMRRFIQSISAYARKRRRNFVIIVENGLDLLHKVDPIEGTEIGPARAYMQAIDAVLQEGILYGHKESCTATEPDRRDHLLSLTKLAQRNRLKVLALDYCDRGKAIGQAYREHAAKGHLAYVAPDRGLDLNRLAASPRRPVNENPDSIVSMRQVRNFAYLRDSSAYGRQDEFALAMHGTNYDMLVVDVFHRPGEPLSKRAVETLKFKKIGARRLVLAYLNIGTAAAYQYFWKPHWRPGSPLWVSAPVRGDPDSYHVEYWRPEWQALITGDTRSYVYGIIDQGFDGMVLDGLDAYHFFESGGEEDEMAGR